VACRERAGKAGRGVYLLPRDAVRTKLGDARTLAPMAEKVIYPCRVALRQRSCSLREKSASRPVSWQEDGKQQLRVLKRNGYDDLMVRLRMEIHRGAWTSLHASRRRLKANLK